MNKEKLTLLNYESLVPESDKESVKMALSEIVGTIFPFRLAVLYDKDSNTYDFVWEAEKDGKKDDVIAEEMSLEEFLTGQYVLCVAFEKYTEKTSHASLDRKYIDAAAAAAQKASELDSIEKFDANGMKIKVQMPCLFMKQDRHGKVYGFDKGVVLDFTENFIKIEPVNKELYRNPVTKEFTIIYRKPERIICGSIFDPTQKSPCQLRAEREAAAKKAQAGEQLTEEEQKLYEEWKKLQEENQNNNQEETTKN